MLPYSVVSHAGRRELHWKWFKKNDVEWFQVFLYLSPPFLQPGAASSLPTPRYQLQNSSYEDPSKGLPLLTAAPRKCWNDLSLNNNTFNSQHIFHRCNYFSAFLNPEMTVLILTASVLKISPCSHVWNWQFHFTHDNLQLSYGKLWCELGLLMWKVQYCQEGLSTQHLDRQKSL